MEEKKEIQPIPFDTKELYNLRMFIFIEKEPQSNKYQRLMLDADQYKKVTKYLASDIFPKDEGHKCGNPDCEGTIFCFSDKPHILPDMQQIHTCQGSCDC